MPDGKPYRDESSTATAPTGTFVAGNNGSDDLYAGPNGKVFRKTESGWEQRVASSWYEADASDQVYLNQQFEARQAGYENYDEYVRQRSP
jgi:hypothetical protein